MFEIDLKRSERPEEPGGSPASEEVRQAATALWPIALVGLGVLAGLWVLNGVQESAIERQKAEIVAIERSVSENRQRLAEVTGKGRTVYALAPAERYWSDDLRLLAEKLPDKTWLTSVRVDAAPVDKPVAGAEAPPPAAPLGLVVEGGVLSAASEGNLDVIGQFVKNLEQDPRFAKSFGGVKLRSVRRGSDPLTLLFTLDVAFKS